MKVTVTVTAAGTTTIVLPSKRKVLWITIVDLDRGKILWKVIDNRLNTPTSTGTPLQRDDREFGSIVSPMHEAEESEAGKVVGLPYLSTALANYGVVIERLQYGNTPGGMRQLIPEVGDPINLELNRKYLVSILMESGAEVLEVRVDAANS